MMDIVHPDIEAYQDRMLPDREPWFIELEERAEAEGFPAVGPQVGRLLELLARAVNARRIMELGSGFGYSGLWFARALPDDGHILLTDFEESNRRTAEGYFKKAGKEHLMSFRVGDALTLLGQEEGPYDIIFNDIDKEFYPRVIEPVYRLLRPGGLFITDNTLWDGKVTLPDPDEPTAAVLEFNRILKAHQGFMTVQLPLRDGVSVCLKTGG